MATITFTEQGIKSIRDTAQRAAAFKTAAKKVGVKVRDIYWCLGPFDGFLIFEAPEADTATSAMLFLAAQGNVKTQTSQAFTAAEIDKIVAGIPAK